MPTNELHSLINLDKLFDCFAIKFYLCGPILFIMIVINVKENESIDKALKRFKKKFERTGVLRELRGRSFFEKPSIKKRGVKLKAAYRQKMYAQENY